MSDAVDGDAFINQPMPIKDAVSMFRRAVGKNEPPYTQVTVKKNNDLVDEWYRSVLVPTSDSRGTIQASRVYPSWTVFYEGKEIYKSQAFENHLPVLDSQQIDFWVDFFSKKDISELYEAGTATVSIGWQYLTAAIRQHFATEKWIRVYSLSTNPRDWERAAASEPKLFRGEPMPFGLTKETFDDISQKVNTLMSTRIVPRA